MKKILSVLIVMALFLCPSTNFVLAASHSVDEEFKASFDILTKLEVLNEYDEVTVEPDKPVSRAEFADTLAKVLKLEQSNETRMYYHDVPKTHFAYGAITALTDIGYMNGTGNDMFSPEQTISNIHAARVLISVLGYDFKLKYSKSPESECYSIAKDIGIDDNISLYSEMTFRDMVIMLKNALIAPTMQLSGVGTNTIEYEQDEEETLLSQIYDCHFVENERVVGANGVTIYNGSLSDEYIMIGENQYIQFYGDMQDFIGSYVDFIYKGDLDEDKCEIVWIEKNGRYDEYNIEINQDNYFDASTYQFKYYNEKEKLRKIDIKRNVSVIYNGGFVDDVESVLTLTNYKARIIENDKGDCDVVVISKYTNFIVGSVNVEECFARSKVDNSVISLDKNDYTYYELANSSGNNISIEEVKSGDVISTYQSVCGKYVRFILSTEQVNGVIDEKGNDDDNQTYIVINSKKYIAHEDLNTDLFDLRAEVCIFLDVEGKIAYVQSANSSLNAMYILGVNIDDSLDDNLIVKAYTKDGKIVKYYTASKVRINGNQYKNGFDEYSLSNVKSEILEKIAICQFDSKGNIKKIETPRQNGEITVSDPLGSKYYRVVSSKLGKTSCIDANTIIFCIPDDATKAEDKKFAVKSKGQLSDWTTYNAECYQLKGNADGVSDFAIIKGYNNSETKNSTSMFVLNGTSMSLNEDDDVVLVLEGFEGKVEKSYYCEYGFNPSGLNPGDVLFLETNPQKEVTNIVKKYNRDSAGGETTASMAAENRVVVGTVNEIKGNIIKLGYNDTGTIDEIFSIETTPVIVVDTDERKRPARVGSIADINTGGVSKAVVQTYQMNQLLVVIYN